MFILHSIKKIVVLENSIRRAVGWADDNQGGYWHFALRHLPAICCAVPSPLYSGERGRGEGVRIPRETRHSCADHAPSPPTPLPRVQGRGEIEGAIKSG